LSHFTHLPDFKAVEEGSITIKLVINNKTTSQTLAKPTRKGIYSFDIKPETAGTGQVIYEIINAKGTFQLVIPNVVVYTDEEKADKAAAEAKISRTNSVVFTKEQSWKIDFATNAVLAEPFGEVIKTTAMVQSAPDDEVVVSAKTDGMILFSGHAVTAGSIVTAGQTLFSISGSTMAGNNLSVRIVEAQNNFERTKNEYERKKDLAKDKIVSEKELQLARAAYENAKANYELLSKNFSQGGQAVSSPMSGYVKRLLVANGQYVTAGQAVVSVSKNKTLILRADVRQKYAPVLGSIVSANIMTLEDNKTYTLQELNGKILSWGRNTNEGNYLIPLSLQIDNTGNFIPGSFVEVYLKTLSNTQALTVANTALIEDQGNFFVFVQLTPELFEKREVKTAATDGVKTEIISGLKAGERIVSKGAVMIKLAQATGTLDAHSGHVH
jgi:RND family efflux transporter MFP subunit